MMFDDDDDDIGGFDDFENDDSSKGVAIEFLVYGIFPTDKINDTYYLVLKSVGSENKLVSIIIGSAEAQSIALYIEDKKRQVPMMDRPLSHDIICSLISGTNSVLQYVIIDDVESDDSKVSIDTVFASLVFADDMVIDSRPSDAIGIAVRMNVPIYIEKDVMDFISFETNKGPADLQKTDDADKPEIITHIKKEKNIKAEKAELNEQLEKAISDEDYEMAALIRDKINKMDNLD